MSTQKTRLNQCEELAQHVVNHSWLSNPALDLESLIHFAIFHSDVKGRRNPEVYRAFFSHSPVKQRERNMESCTEWPKKLGIWDAVIPFQLIYEYKRFRTSCCFHFQGRNDSDRHAVGYAGRWSLKSTVRGSGAHPASYSVGTPVCFPVVKRPEREVDHWPSAKGKNAWNYIFASPPVCRHSLDRESCTFIRANRNSGQKLVCMVS